MTVKLESTYPEKIIIGTRGSRLALWQANAVKNCISKISQNICVEIRVIKTSGDWKPEQGEVRLEALCGGKAQFAKEIEEALLAGEIDMAVHSVKDMETVLPKGLVLAGVLPRDDARDAFLSNDYSNIDDLPKGAVIGTASVRRQAIVLNRRPDLKVVPLRGNVEKRIEKLRNGQVDATFLACAGLERLGLASEISSIVEVEEMLPAVGQGAIGLEVRAGDVNILPLISQINSYETYVCVKCERAVLRALEGSCHTPIGVYARIIDDSMVLDACVISTDGRGIWKDRAVSNVISLDNAVLIGNDLGTRLKKRVPENIL